jgi:ABC transporter substrate binding protein
VAVLASPFKSKLRLEAENAVLRHQLIVLRRSLHGRVRLTNHDRWFFIRLCRWFPSILQAFTIIRAETLLRWHRAGFRFYRLAVLWDTSTAERQVDAVSDEARARNVALQILKAHSPADFEPAFDAATDGKVDAMLILSSPLFGTNPKLLAEPAIRHKLPTITFFPEFARVGGLMAYGTNLIDLFSQAGVVIAKILGGETSATLPVERPSRFQLIVDLKTAAEIGVTVPTSILLRADEVIE